MNCIKKGSFYFIDRNEFNKAMDRVNIRVYVDYILTLCNKFRYKGYIVGGFVRDFLIGYISKDIDVVIEGNALDIGRQMSSDLNISYREHDRFLTGTLRTKNKLTIDLVTARREYYDSPASLPRLEKSTIYEDLYRRDFTINAIAVEINDNSVGRIVDYFGGLKDLKNKKIRILHDLSFVDDPTRILRAIKFEQRFDFNIDKNTMKLLLEGINNGFLNRLSGDRLRNEIYLLLEEKSSHKYIRRLLELKVFHSIYPNIEFDDEIIEQLMEFENEKEMFLHMEIDDILIKLLLLFSKCSTEEIENIRDYLAINNYYSQSLNGMIKYKGEILNSLYNRSISNYDLYQLFGNVTEETVISIYYISNDQSIRNKILFYLWNLSKVKLHIAGADLVNLNIKPGKIYGYILAQALKEKLNGSLTTYEEEMEYVLKLLSTIDYK